MELLEGIEYPRTLMEYPKKEGREINVQKKESEVITEGEVEKQIKKLKKEKVTRENELENEVWIYVVKRL